VTLELIEDTNLNLLWISKNCLQKFITYNITLILIESDAFANVQKKIFFDRKQITHSNLKKSKTTDKIVTNLNQRLSIGLSCNRRNKFISEFSHSANKFRPAVTTLQQLNIHNCPCFQLRQNQPGSHSY